MKFPINYIEPIFRPPSEAKSVLIQVTIGCSNNLCTYCDMYRSKKYSERNLIDIENEIDQLKLYFERLKVRPSRFFLCDGDALGASQKLLVGVLKKLNNSFPWIERVGIYATAQNMLDKSLEQLVELRKLKLSIAYLGLESGSDQVLHMIVKRNTANDMLEGSLKVKQAGMKLSVIAMLGVGGKKFSKQHITDTAKVISEISPEYFSFLTTMAISGTPFYTMVSRGMLQELTSFEMFDEMLKILEQMNPKSDILFRANHVSNQFPLGGTLPKDTDRIVSTIKQWMTKIPKDQYPPKPYSM